MNPLELIRDDVRALHAYPVQPSEGLVKLDVMGEPAPPCRRRCSANWVNAWARWR
jgi:hypothetical protein